MVSEIFYRLFIDPLLSPVQNHAVKLIPDGSNTIDIACGIGTLAIKIATGSSRVTAIDLSPGSIAYARKRAQKAGRSRLQFFEMDATDLSGFEDNEFDYSTISMAVHQFSPETGKQILLEMARISKSIVVIDYNHPQPKNFGGIVVRMIERLAGREHNRNFKAYLEMGGVGSIAKDLGLKVDPRYGGKRNILSVQILEA